MAPLMISILALLFSVLSFWWLQARTGRILTYEPSSFAAFISHDKVTVVRLPILLHNTGARARVVRSVRVLVTLGDVTETLRWRNFRTQLAPDKGDVADLPSPYVIDGRAVDTHFIEFGTRFAAGLPEPVEHMVTIEALIDGSESWQHIGEPFPLRLWHWQAPEFARAFSNDISPCEEGEPEKSRQAVIRHAWQAKVPLTWHVDDV